MDGILWSRSCKVIDPAAFILVTNNFSQPPEPVFVNLLGHEMALASLVAISGPKKSQFSGPSKKVEIFRAHTFQWPLKWICPHQNHVHSCKCNSLWQRVHTEWQWPLSGVPSIMIDKLSQPGDVRGMHPLYFIYHHVRSCDVRSSWEGRYTPPIYTLLLYVLCGIWQ